MRKEKLFTIGKKDFEIQTFRAGGKGGQHQNKTETGVRIIHKDSRAVGECRNHASQYQNKKEAFNRLTKSKKFKLWINRKVYEHDIGKSIEKEVEESLTPENLKIEVKENNKWVEEKTNER